MVRHIQRPGRWLAAIAVCCLTMPAPLAAADSAGDARHVPSTPASVLDVKLGRDNLLRGAAVSAAGEPRGGWLVTIARANQALATAETNAHGEFGFRLKHGGVYQLAVGERIVICRVWSEQVAPPAAKSQLLLVTDDTLARGQRPLGEVLFSTPVLVGAVIAAAVAIPLALSSSDDRASGS